MVAHRALALAALALVVASCLPYPLHSPRVDPGISFGGSAALRPIEGRYKGAAPVPEAALSGTVGFARIDGRGPGLRFGWQFGIPDILGSDLYAQLPRVGPLVAGAGMLITPPHHNDDHRNWVNSPYGMIGWRTSEERMIYGSLVGYSTRRSTQPESTATGQGFLIGLDRHWPGVDGEPGGSARLFLALFNTNSKLEATSLPTRSLFVVGGSVDAPFPSGMRRRRR